MDNEQETAKTSEPVDTKEDTTNGAETSKNPILDKAEEIASRIEAGNKKQEELINRQEDLLAKKTLGGQSQAGEEPEKPKEVSNADYAKQAINGQYNKEA